MARTQIIPTNLLMFSGDTKVLNVTVLDQDDVIVDLTGASAAFRVAQHHGQTPIIEKTVGSGITITDAVNGILEVRLLPADTEALANAYAYELKVTDAAGRETTVLFGTLNIHTNTV